MDNAEYTSIEQVVAAQAEYGGSMPEVAPERDMFDLGVQRLRHR